MTRSNSSSLANHEVVVLAAYLAGAGNSYADTEDIAVQANIISPGRFTWRKYPDQINIDTVRKRLWDAKKESKGGYLIGSEREGWLLTQAGLNFCVSNDALLSEKAPQVDRRSRQENSWATRERIRMLGESAFSKFLNGNFNTITRTEAERFFNIDDYVVGAARTRRLERTFGTFRSDPDLAAAINEISRLLGGGRDE